MTTRVCRVCVVLLGCAVMFGAAQMASNNEASQTVQGLQITAKSLERAKRVSLQDCPPGANIVRGVIRPTEDNEFATIQVDVKVLASFEPGEMDKPVLQDEAGTTYKTAQSFRDLEAENSYTCSFSFRVPTGTKITRLSIGEASFDVSTLEK